MDEYITVFTDGSCLNNQSRKKSRGGIGVFFGDNDSNNVSELLTCDKVTNQVAELLAISKALDILIINNNKKFVYLYTDSKYAINIFSDWIKKWEKNNWKKMDGKMILNSDIIIDINNKLSKQHVIFKHVRSHLSKPPIDDPKYSIWYGNNQADFLATSATK